MAQTPQREASSAPERPFRVLGAASRRAPYYGRERSDRATLGAASWLPMLRCASIFAHSAAPNVALSERSRP
eukprot:11750812-Alexandrium_andersonii.AAC.1